MGRPKPVSFTRDKSKSKRSCDSMQTSDKVGWVRFVRFFAFIPSSSFESRSAQHGWCLLALISAKTRGNVAASSFQRPPMSIPKKQPAGTSGPVTVPGQFIISSSALPLGLCLGICLPASLVHVLAYLERHQRSVNPPDLWTALALDDFVLAKGFFIFIRHMDMWNVNDTRTCPAIAMEGWCDLFFSLRSMISPG